MTTRIQAKDELRETAQQCLAHLAYEFRTLCQVRDQLEQLQAAMLTADLQQLSQYVEAQWNVQHTLQDLQTHRRQLRRQLCLALGCDQGSASLEDLTELMEGDLRRELLRQRTLVTQTLEEVERLGLRITALSRNGLQVLGRILEQLNGHQVSTDRYTRNGQPDAPVCPGILRTRC